MTLKTDTCTSVKHMVDCYTRKPKEHRLTYVHKDTDSINETGKMNGWRTTFPNNKRMRLWNAIALMSRSPLSSAVSLIKADVRLDYI